MRMAQKNPKMLENSNKEDNNHTASISNIIEELESDKYSYDIFNHLEFSEKKVNIEGFKNPSSNITSASINKNIQNTLKENEITFINNDNNFLGSKRKFPSSNKEDNEDNGDNGDNDFIDDENVLINNRYQSMSENYDNCNEDDHRIVNGSENNQPGISLFCIIFKDNNIQIISL